MLTTATVACASWQSAPLVTAVGVEAPKPLARQLEDHMPAPQLSMFPLDKSVTHVVGEVKKAAKGPADGISEYSQASRDRAAKEKAQRDGQLKAALARSNTMRAKADAEARGEAYQPLESATTEADASALVDSDVDDAGWEGDADASAADGGVGEESTASESGLYRPSFIAEAADLRVLQWILDREEQLTRLHAMVEPLEAVPPSPRTLDSTIRLLWTLRHTTVEVVEAIQAWQEQELQQQEAAAKAGDSEHPSGAHRRSSSGRRDARSTRSNSASRGNRDDGAAGEEPPPPRFIYNGSVYMRKILADTDIVCDEPTIARALDCEADSLRNNPLMMPRNVPEAAAAEPDAPPPEGGGVKLGDPSAVDQRVKDVQAALVEEWRAQQEDGKGAGVEPHEKDTVDRRLWYVPGPAPARRVPAPRKTSDAVPKGQVYLMPPSVNIKLSKSAHTGSLLSHSVTAPSFRESVEASAHKREHSDAQPPSGGVGRRMREHRASMPGLPSLVSKEEAAVKAAQSRKAKKRGKAARHTRSTSALPALRASASSGDELPRNNSSIWKTPEQKDAEDRALLRAAKAKADKADKELNDVWRAFYNDPNINRSWTAWEDEKSKSKHWQYQPLPFVVVRDAYIPGDFEFVVGVGHQRGGRTASGASGSPSNSPKRKGAQERLSKTAGDEKKQAAKEDARYGELHSSSAVAAGSNVVVPLQPRRRRRRRKKGPLPHDSPDRFRPKDPEALDEFIKSHFDPSEQLRAKRQAQKQRSAKKRRRGKKKSKSGTEVFEKDGERFEVSSALLDDPIFPEVWRVSGRDIVKLSMAKTETPSTALVCKLAVVLLHPGDRQPHDLSWGTTRTKLRDLAGLKELMQGFDAERLARFKLLTVGLEVANHPRRFSPKRIAKRSATAAAIWCWVLAAVQARPEYAELVGADFLARHSKSAEKLWSGYPLPEEDKEEGEATQSEAEVAADAPPTPASGEDGRLSAADDDTDGASLPKQRGQGAAESQLGADELVAMDITARADGVEPAGDRSDARGTPATLTTPRDESSTRSGGEDGASSKDEDVPRDVQAARDWAARHGPPPKTAPDRQLKFQVEAVRGEHGLHGAGSFKEAYATAGRPRAVDAALANELAEQDSGPETPPRSTRSASRRVLRRGTTRRLGAKRVVEPGTPVGWDAGGSLDDTYVEPQPILSRALEVSGCPMFVSVFRVDYDPHDPRAHPADARRKAAAAQARAAKQEPLWSQKKVKAAEAPRHGVAFFAVHGVPGFYFKAYNTIDSLELRLLLPPTKLAEECAPLYGAELYSLNSSEAKILAGALVMRLFLKPKGRPLTDAAKKKQKLHLRKGGPVQVGNAAERDAAATRIQAQARRRSGARKVARVRHDKLLDERKRAALAKARPLASKGRRYGKAHYVLAVLIDPLAAQRLAEASPSGDTGATAHDTPFVVRVHNPRTRSELTYDVTNADLKRVGLSPYTPPADGDAAAASNANKPRPTDVHAAQVLLLHSSVEEQPSRHIVVNSEPELGDPILHRRMVISGVPMDVDVHRLPNGAGFRVTVVDPAGNVSTQYLQATRESLGLSKTAAWSEEHRKLDELLARLELQQREGDARGGAGGEGSGARRGDGGGSGRYADEGRSAEGLGRRASDLVLGLGPTAEELARRAAERERLAKLRGTPIYTNGKLKNGVYIVVSAYRGADGGYRLSAHDVRGSEHIKMTKEVPRPAKFSSDTLELAAGEKEHLAQLTDLVQIKSTRSGGAVTRYLVLRSDTAQAEKPIVAAGRQLDGVHVIISIIRTDGSAAVAGESSATIGPSSRRAYKYTVQDVSRRHFLQPLILVVSCQSVGLTGSSSRVEEKAALTESLSRLRLVNQSTGHPKLHMLPNPRDSAEALRMQRQLALSKSQATSERARTGRDNRRLEAEVSTYSQEHRISSIRQRLDNFESSLPANATARTFELIDEADRLIIIAVRMIRIAADRREIVAREDLLGSSPKQLQSFVDNLCDAAYEALKATDEADRAVQACIMSLNADMKAKKAEVANLRRWSKTHSQRLREARARMDTIAARLAAADASFEDDSAVARHTNMILESLELTGAAVDMAESRLRDAKMLEEAVGPIDNLNDGWEYTIDTEIDAWHHFVLSVAFAIHEVDEVGDVILLAISEGVAPHLEGVVLDEFGKPISQEVADDRVDRMEEVLSFSEFGSVSLELTGAGSSSIVYALTDVMCGANKATRHLLGLTWEARGQLGLPSKASPMEFLVSEHVRGQYKELSVRLKSLSAHYRALLSKMRVTGMTKLPSSNPEAAPLGRSLANATVALRIADAALPAAEERATAGSSDHAAVQEFERLVRTAAVRIGEMERAVARADDSLKAREAKRAERSERRAARAEKKAAKGAKSAKGIKGGRKGAAAGGAGAAGDGSD